MTATIPNGSCIRVTRDVGVRDWAPPLAKVGDEGKVMFSLGTGYVILFNNGGSRVLELEDFTVIS